MEDLIQLQAFQIKALQDRNAYLENELKQAKQIFQDLINDWEVIEPVELRPTILDTMFDNPLKQLDELL